MASQYAEDIGYIKASIKGISQDLVEIRTVQVTQQVAIDMLLADQVFRRKIRVIMKTTVFIGIAIATLKFGDIPKLF